MTSKKITEKKDHAAHIQNKDQNINSQYVFSKNEVKNNYFGNNSFSGADMVAIMHISGLNGIKGTYTLGSLQTLSYSTSMQRMPIRSIGNVNAKDYVMGQRTIAGSLVFAVFDKHFAYEAMKAIQGITEEEYHFLADELPPFDITITFANEYGKIAKLAIYGVRLINEGQVMSINDIYTENTYQYVATDIDYLSDQTTNTSGAIYQPLTPNPNSTSAPIQITDVTVEEEETEVGEDLSKYQLVYVKTTDGYSMNGKNTPGKIQLDLFKRVDYGTIHIEQTDGPYKKGYELTPGVIFPIVDNDIPPGNYIAKYFSGISFSKYTQFTIHVETKGEPVPHQPIVVLEQKMADNTFTIGIQAVDDYTKGIQYTLNREDEKTWKTIEPMKPYSVVKGLKAYTSYYFRAFNDDHVSEVLAVFTDERREHLFSDFEAFVIANRHYFPNEYVYIKEMWGLIWGEWKLEPTGSIAIAVRRIKDKLDLSDKKVEQAYALLCHIAAEYEENQALYISQQTLLKTPKVIDIAKHIIEFDKNIVSLEIKSLANGFKKIVPAMAFQSHGNKYRYTIQSKYEGLHVVVASNRQGLYAPPLIIYLPSPYYGDIQLSQQLQANYILRQKIIKAELNMALPGILVHSPQKEKLLQELSNNVGIIRTGVPSPIVTYIDKNEVKVSCDIPLIYTETCYLCLAPIADIGSHKLKERVQIIPPHFNYTYYPSKHMLQQDTRYGLWIEDTNNKIISRTTGFDFTERTTLSSLQTLKNKETVATIKKLYQYEINKSFADSYVEENSLSDTSLLNHVIQDVMLSISYIDPHKSLYLLDALSAQHKYLYALSRTTDIPNLTWNMATHSLTGSFKISQYTQAHALIYTIDQGEDPAKEQLFTLTEDTLDLTAIDQDAAYICLYFANDMLTKVSEMLLIDVKNKTVLGMKAKVKKS